MINAVADWHGSSLHFAPMYYMIPTWEDPKYGELPFATFLCPRNLGGSG
jgi:hypothetical protein